MVTGFAHVVFRCVRFVVFVNVALKKAWVLVVLTENVFKVFGFVG